MPNDEFPTLLVTIFVLIIAVGGFYLSNELKTRINQQNLDQQAQISQNSQKVIPSPPVPVPADNERTEARETGVSWWLRNGQWVKMENTVGELKTSDEDPDIWNTSGIIEQVDPEENTISVEFADENCIQDVSSLEVEVIELSAQRDRSQIIFESPLKNRICGTGDFTVNNVQIRWRVWNKDEHQELKPGTITDLSSGDMVFITADREVFEQLEGETDRILVVQ